MSLLSQSEVESQVAAVEHLMGSIVHLMLGRGPSSSAAKPGGGRATSDKATKVACMLSIQEYIVFCHRLKILPGLLEDVEVRGG